MKQPTAPINPGLPGRWAKLSLAENIRYIKAINKGERDARKALYKSISEESISQTTFILH